MQESKTTKKCFWPWDHQWSKWEVYEQPIVLGVWAGAKAGTQGSMESQKRKCTNCGLEERRDF